MLRNFTDKKYFYYQSDDADRELPNGWGRQRYRDYEYVYEKDQTKAALNDKKPKAFIQKFTEKYITGISLKAESGQIHYSSVPKKYKRLSNYV